MSDDISRNLDKAKESISGIASQLREDFSSRASDVLQNTGKNIRDSSIGKTVSDAVDKGSDKVDEARSYLKGKDGRVLANIESFVHDRPITSAALAFVGGIFVNKIAGSFGNNRNR